MNQNQRFADVARRSPAIAETLEPRTMLSAYLFADLKGGPTSSHPGNLITIGDALFFTTRDDSSDSIGLWRSDGASPPTLIHSFTDAGDQTATLFSYGNTPIAAIGDENGQHTELYKVGGQFGVKRIARGVGEVSFFGATADRAIFLVRRSGSSMPGQLWATDGSAENTVLLQDNGPTSGEYYSNPTVWGGKLYYSRGYQGEQLWRTTGTPSGTRRPNGWFEDAPAKPTFFGTLAALGDRLFFAAYESTDGWSVWGSDGTSAGTGIMKNIDQTLPYTLTTAGNWLYFWVYSHDEPLLYRSNGRASGTNPFTTFPLALTLNDFRAAGDRVYFNYGASEDGAVGALWTSDGTAGGTVAVNIDQNPTTMLPMEDGGLYFGTGIDGALYRADGANVRSIREVIGPHDSLTDTPINSIAALGGRIFFNAGDDDHGDELWEYHTERSIAGTVFNDTNSNGVRDAGEGPLPGLRVFLDLDGDGKFDKGEIYTFTTGTGRFALLDIQPGTYRLTLAAPASYTLTTSKSYKIRVAQDLTVTRNFGAHT